MSDIKIIDIKDEPDFLYVLIGGNPWKKIYKKLFISHLRKIDLSLPYIEYQNRVLAIEEKIAKAECIRMLAKRAFFTAQLKDKLELKAFGEEAIQKAIAYCQELGMLADEKRIEYLIQKALEKGKGPQYIKAKLKSYGIEEPLLQKHLQKISSLQTTKGIQKLLQTRLRKFSLSDPKEKRKVILFLQRRGFSLESIFSALNK